LYKNKVPEEEAQSRQTVAGALEERLNARVNVNISGLRLSQPADVLLSTIFFFGTGIVSLLEPSMRKRRNGESA